MILENSYPNLKKTEEYMLLLLDIRKRMLEIYNKNEGVFVDDYIRAELPDENSQKEAIMPLAFGVESLLIPIGFFTGFQHDLSGQFKEDIDKLLNEQSYLLKEFILDEDDKEIRKSIKKICDKAFPRLEKTLLIVNDKDESKYIKPYGQHDILDLQMWRFAALVDMDDVFSPDNDNFLRKGKACLDNLMGALGKISFAENCYLFGWYIRPSFYDGLQEFNRRIGRERLIEKWGDRLSISNKEADWTKFLNEIFNHQAVRDSIIMSTRAVISSLTVAREVYKNREEQEFLEYFDDLEKNLFKVPAFAQFILTELFRLKESAELNDAEINRMFQIIGILGFAIPSNYFSEYFSIDKPIYAENNQIMNDIIQLFEKKEVQKILTDSESNFLNEEVFFVATEDWPELFDGKPEKAKTLDGNRLEEMSGEGNAIPYSLGLPTIVKSLANISLNVRMNENDIPGWLEKIEKINEILADKMFEIHVGTTADDSKYIKLGKDEDLSVTAGVVDAMTLWTAVLLLKASKDNEIEKYCEYSSHQVNSDDLDSNDFEVFKNFMAILKRHTQPQSGTTPKQVIEVPEWFNAFFKLILDCYPYGDDYWGKEVKDRTKYQLPSFDDFIKLNSLIHFMAREYHKDIDDVLQAAKDSIKGYRNQEGTFGSKLIDIERELKDKFTD